MQLFSKPLTATDVCKRLAIPSKVLPWLLPNGAGHTVKLKIRHGAAVWPIVCSTRRIGFKKPVFCGGWKRFVDHNKLNVGDIVALYKDEEFETGHPCSHYKIEVTRAIPMDSGAGSTVTAGNFSGEENCTAGYVSAGDCYREASCNGTYSDTTTYGASWVAGYVTGGNYSGEGSSKANFMIEDEEEVENSVPLKLVGDLVAGIRPPVVSSAGISDAKEEVEFHGINLDLTLSPPKMNQVITI